MNKEDLEYLYRLNKWNNSEKYISEVNFLELLLNPLEGENILDYGCGTGVCLELLKKRTKANYYGYDVKAFFDEEAIPAWFQKCIDLSFSFNKIYFMHSLAHIKNLKEVLHNLKRVLKENRYIYLITPNKDFDDYFKNFTDKNYIPDDTVVKHYTINEIVSLFENSGYSIEIIGQFGKYINQFHERIFAIASLNL